MTRLRRRELLAAAIAGAGLSFTDVFRGASAQTASTKHLVFVFLRGGADALGLVTPLGAEAALLRAARPTLAIAAPIALSPTLGLNPGFAPWLGDADLMNDLNVIVHAGSVNETRSHFEQMDHIETGDSVNLPATGFLGVGARAAAWNSAALGTISPASLRGTNPVVMADPARVRPDFAYGSLKPGMSRATRMNLMKGATGTGADARVDGLARDSEAQMNLLASQLGSVSLADLTGRGGYVSASPFTFGPRLALAAALMGTTFRPAFLTVDAEHQWDTHAYEDVNNPTAYYSISRKAQDLAKNLLAFKRDLTARGKWESTVVVVMSEFGRTVKENGTRGTDHGRGGVMFLMGGPVRAHADPAYLGRRSLMIPEAPGASTPLEVVHDYRLVMGEVLERHMAMPRATVLSLFRPEGSVSPESYLNVIR